MNRASCIVYILICLFSNELLAQNAPVTTAGTLATKDSAITISLTATNFSNIASCNLVLNYDPGIATATAVATGPLLGGNLDANLSVPGEIALGWYIFPAKTLTGNPILFNITFEKVKTGTSLLTWSDTANSCLWYDGNYHPLVDTPTSAYYVNGALTFLPGLGIYSGKGDGNSSAVMLACSPDPFSGVTKLNWYLPVNGQVLLEIMNMQGEKVETLVDEPEQEGFHSLQVSSIFIRPGIYLARIVLKTNNEQMTRSIKIICYQ